MAASKGLCIIANMGTQGDFTPAFLAAARFAHEGGRVAVLAQPKDEAYVMQKMGTAIGFSRCEEVQLELEGKCQQHVFHPPRGGPPKVVSGEEFRRVSYLCKKIVFAAESGGSLIFYFPSAAQGMNEEEYQTSSEPGRAAFKTEAFGDFLSLWQGAVAAVKSHEGLSGVFVTNCYDREFNMVHGRRTFVGPAGDGKIVSLQKITPSSP